MTKTNEAPASPWAEALGRYRRRPWRKMEHGYLRMGSSTFYVLPRRIDAAEARMTRAWRRFRGRCTECSMHGMHKMSCSRWGMK